MEICTCGHRAAYHQPVAAPIGPTGTVLHTGPCTADHFHCGCSAFVGSGTPTEFPPPTITRWVRFQGVSVEALRKELADWLDFLDSQDPHRCPRACSEHHTYDAACALGSTG